MTDIGYTYDRGRLGSVTAYRASAAALPSPAASTYAWGADGRLASLTLPGEVVKTFEYNDLSQGYYDGQPEDRLTVQQAGQNLFSQSQVSDAWGRPTSLQHQRWHPYIRESMSALISIRSVSKNTITPNAMWNALKRRGYQHGVPSELMESWWVGIWNSENREVDTVNGPHLLETGVIGEVRVVIGAGEYRLWVDGAEADEYDPYRYFVSSYPPTNPLIKQIIGGLAGLAVCDLVGASELNDGEQCHGTVGIGYR